MKEQNKLGIIAFGLFVGGFLTGAAPWGSIGEAKGAREYRAQLDADCKLVGFHRIGENVYICKDTKADQDQAIAQRNQTVEGK